ncbi:phosphatidylinositol transfer protein [Coniella lustricola]|uniref:Phosphatidylglycerol/phosphatidylinositol transfer protein n=1 Tax=Coniella lustricola TaxID=2025994 RepID=A0A2T2ZZ40_9PEZI|nr:phosphatidylinositol transfer protein [Coniella lustricola]
MSDDNKVPGNNPLHLCKGDHAKDVLKITRVDFDPNSPKHGSSITISAQGQVSSTIAKGAKITLGLELGGKKLLDKQFDFCDVIKMVGQSCPLSAGSPTLSKTIQIPSMIPQAEYHLTINAVAADGTPITCIEGTTTMT